MQHYSRSFGPSRLLAAAVLTAFLPAAAMAQGKSALETDPQGWIDLLQDRSMKKWTRVAIPPSDPLKDPAWKLDAASGILVCEGARTGHEWLRFDEEFQDFILHAEWRFHPQEGNPRYNSGLFFRNSADGTLWHQAQTGAAGGWIFGMMLVDGKPVRVNLSKEMKENRVRPVGEWNTYEVRALGPRLSLWINGDTVSVYEKSEIYKGYVGLEAEGYRIEFRNVKLKKLK